ncbi:flavodoxin domain-containing protein [Streptomyces sp. NPDC004111]|uniref:flavodoxin domain-containing protein n=1 Tax=Streptomyces sp. NPDC004111 TaxID=3364690 RepID=UPI003695A6EF
MDVLVGYATAHGSTREIACRLGGRLAKYGHTVDVRAMERVERPDTYQVFVLGSAVHGMAWLPEAQDFVRRNHRLLGVRPVWLFSVGMPGALRGPWKRLADREAPVILKNLPQLPPFRGHRLLSGVIARDQLSRGGRLRFRLMGCRYGDFRDWAAIEEWADRIALDLAPCDSRPPGG